MNPKITIIIVIVLIVMIVGGRNPVEEARKEEEEKYKGVNDPLIRAITEYHEESTPLGGGVHGNGLDESGRRQKQMPDYMYSTGRAPAAKSKQPAQRNNGYYPPPPLPKNNMQQPAGSNGVFGPSSDNRMYLENGQRLAYGGTNVYYIDENGHQRPLPDGKHTMANGRQILISGGKKVLAAN